MAVMGSPMFMDPHPFQQFAGLHKSVITIILFQLDIALKCGADVVLNPSKCDVKAEIDKLSSGYGCDVYLVRFRFGASKITA